MDPFQKDPSFLERFRAGRAEALERVYRYYHGPLRGFVRGGFAFRSNGRNLHFRGDCQHADVEDVIQETFRRAFGTQARARYDGIRPYKNYLFTVARNALMTELTLQKRMIPVGEALTNDGTHDDITPLEAWIWAHQQHQSESLSDLERCLESLEICGLVVAFLETLDSEQRLFFETRFLGRMSQEQTADVMGWNRARVRKIEAQLRRAFVTRTAHSGYLETRAEAKRVRRQDNLELHERTVARSRDFWRSAKASPLADMIFEAA